SRFYRVGQHEHGRFFRKWYRSRIVKQGFVYEFVRIVGDKFIVEIIHTGSSMMRPYEVDDDLWKLMSFSNINSFEHVRNNDLRTLLRGQFLVRIYTCLLVFYEI